MTLALATLGYLFEEGITVLVNAPPSTPPTGMGAFDSTPVAPRGMAESSFQPPAPPTGQAVALSYDAAPAAPSGTASVTNAAPAPPSGSAVEQPPVDYPPVPPAGSAEEI